MLDFAATVNRDRLTQLEDFLLEMIKRGHAELNGTPYNAPDPALDLNITYFQPFMVAPSDRSAVARWIIGSQEKGLADNVNNRLLNIFNTFVFGPSEVYNLLTGEADLKDAWVDFERVLVDPDYVKEIGENIAYGKQHGLRLWTSTELHTSLQTEARNFCRIKHGIPDRPATPTDLIEWMASWITDGHVDRILEAKSLRGGYNAITGVRGVGPYYAGNPVMMIAALPETSYTHKEPFCAPGGGALKSLEYLFGRKFGFEPAVKAIAWMFEQQDKLMPRLHVPDVFQNMQFHYGTLFAENQTYYTCNSLEVGLCQFSVYLRFLEDPSLIKRRLNPPPPNLQALADRKAGNPWPAPGKKKPVVVSHVAVATASNLLEF